MVKKFPSYTRGLAYCGAYALVSLSRIRETAVFGGMPIATNRDELKCGVRVVDLRTGRTISTLEFESGVEEIFDVQVLSETRCPAICGPRPDEDCAQDIWIVPRPDQVATLLQRPAVNSTTRFDREELVQQALQFQGQRRVQESIGGLMARFTS